MKQLFSMILAGVTGGLIVLGATVLLQEPHSDRSVNDLVNARTVAHFSPTSNSEVSVPFDFSEAADKAMPAVVHISAKATSRTTNNRGFNDPFSFFFGDRLFEGNPFDRRAGKGSGVIVSPDGYIVTNNHVVGFADEVTVTLFDNRQYAAEIIGTDEQTDLAVIKIDGQEFPHINYGNSDQAKVGEWVLAVGNPFDLTSTVTAGIISAKGRDINLLNNNRSIEAFIQTDAAVNPGNSGGALVNTDGELIGINTAIATQTGMFAGYSFAIPVNMARKIVDDIIKYGSYQRAYLGINITDLDSELATDLGLNRTQGVVIHSLADGGAAQYAGLLPNDVIIGVDGKEIRTVPELQEVVGSTKIGDTVLVKIIRKGKTKEIPVQLTAG